MYYSATGNVYELAKSMAEGAAGGGAEVRLRRVQELASPDAIANNPRWQRHLSFCTEQVELAQVDDLAWADGIALGTPTRFGLPAAQLKQFLDETGRLWATGVLADRVVTGFTSASTSHGGLESTILALMNTAYHWGSIIMPVGYSDVVFEESGNPYGASFVSRKGASPDSTALAAAHAQGRRLVTIARALAVARPAPS